VSHAVALQSPAYMRFHLHLDSIAVAPAGDESEGDADHDEDAQRDDMYDEVYDEDYGGGGGGGGEQNGTHGETFANEDYGSLEYDHYREDDDTGGQAPEAGHDGGGGDGGHNGGEQTDEGIDIYGDVDEGMELAAPAALGDQHEQPEDQQQGQQQPGSRPQSAGGLKGGRHPGNLGLRGGGRSSRSRSASRENDRWGGSEDRLDRPGGHSLYMTLRLLSPQTSGRRISRVQMMGWAMFCQQIASDCNWCRCRPLASFPHRQC
jgi:hypothetical protein